MAEIDDPVHDVARLEMALERIAALARRDEPGPIDQPQTTPDRQPAADTAVAVRLDALIARLRAALAPRA